MVAIQSSISGMGTLMERLCAQHLQKLDLQFHDKATSGTQGHWVIRTKDQEEAAIFRRYRHPPCEVHAYAHIALRTWPRTPGLPQTLQHR